MLIDIISLCKYIIHSTILYPSIGFELRHTKWISYSFFQSIVYDCFVFIQFIAELS